MVKRRSLALSARFGGRQLPDRLARKKLAVYESIVSQNLSNSKIFEMVNKKTNQYLRNVAWILIGLK